MVQKWKKNAVSTWTAPALPQELTQSATCWLWGPKQVASPLCLLKAVMQIHLCSVLRSTRAWATAGIGSVRCRCEGRTAICVFGAQGAATGWGSLRRLTNQPPPSWWFPVSVSCAEQPNPACFHFHMTFKNGLSILK